MDATTNSYNSEFCKVAFVGDQHVSDSTPSTRTDDYTTAIFSKIEFILAYCISKRIRHVVLLGDLFHKKRPSFTSHKLVIRLIKIFTSFKEEYKLQHGEEARIFSLVGNHDIQFTIKRVEYQPISVLMESGALEVLDGVPIPLDCNVELNGFHYSEETESGPDAYHLQVGREDAFKVWCFHSTLLPDGQSFFGSWVNFADVKDIKANVVVCGHYHPGYEIHEIYDKVWFNPGAISRGTAEEHNLTRQLKFVAMIYRKDGTYSFKDVPIPHQPASQVFAVDSLKQAKVKRNDISGFVDDINSSVAEQADITTVDGIKALLPSMCTDAKVIARTLQYIEEAADEQGAV